MPQAGEEPPVGDTCYVAGWGTLESGGNSPDELNSVNVELYDDSVCANDQSYGPNEFLGELEICAGKFEGGKDSCQGDSGGPLICLQGGQPVLTGVVSWGYGCADQGYPGVYAEVSEYIPWIDSIVLGSPTTTMPTTVASCPECLIPEGTNCNGNWATANSKIVGGAEVVPHSWNFIASLQWTGELKNHKNRE